MLSSVILHDSLEIIGASAFAHCVNLESINLPNSLFSIQHEAFLESGLISISFPNSILEIEKSSFVRCNNLKSVTIPDSVEIIRLQAFMDCHNLAEISLPNVLEIGDFAFMNCTSLRTITLPNSIITIGVTPFCISESNGYIKPLPNLKIYVSSERVKQLVINSGFNLTNNIIIGTPSTLSIKREDETLK